MFSNPIQVSPIVSVSFRTKGSRWELQIAFSYHFFSCLKTTTASWLSLAFMILRLEDYKSVILKNVSQFGLFVSCSPMIKFRWFIFGKNITQMMPFFFFPSLHLIKWHITSNCPVPDDVHFDHLNKVVSARFFHYKYIFFFLLLSILWGSPLNVCKYPFLIKLSMYSVIYSYLCGLVILI